MAEINFSLLQPVDTGAQVLQGFQTGMALMKQFQVKNALRTYLQHPDDPQAFNALSFVDPDTANSIQQRRQDQEKLARQRQEELVMRQIGATAAGGDSAGARKMALESGNFDLAKQFNDLDEASRKRAAEFWQQAGPLAFKLKQSPDPQARMALWQQARPILEEQGADRSLLDRFDPTNDTQLDAAVTLSQKIGDLIDQGKITWHQQGEQPSFATDFMGRPVGSQNPYAKGSGASPAPAPAVSAVASTLSSGGLPPHVVAGFLGNFEAEGGYGGAKGDGGTAHGIAQWRDERRANFERVIGKAPTQASPAEQARFVLWEMQNPEAAGMTAEQRDAILNAKSAPEAASLIDQFYERSSGQHRQRRVEAAQRHAATGMDEGAIRSQAEAAIRAGADPAAVKARAKSMGVDL